MRTIHPAVAAPVIGGPVPRALTTRIITELGDAVAELRCAGSERLMRAGVSMSHLHVMWLIQGHGELSMTRLADMLDVSLSNATGLVDRMEERGLIERSRVADDRRVVLVGLSAHGRELLAEIDLVKSDMAYAVLRHLDDAQLDALLHTLGDLRAAIEAARAAGELPLDPADDAAHHDHHHHHGPAPSPASLPA